MLAQTVPCLFLKHENFSVKPSLSCENFHVYKANMKNFIKSAFGFTKFITFFFIFKYQPTLILKVGFMIYYLKNVISKKKVLKSILSAINVILKP